MRIKFKGIPTAAEIYRQTVEELIRKRFQGPEFEKVLKLLEVIFYAGVSTTNAVVSELMERGLVLEGQKVAETYYQEAMKFVQTNLREFGVNVEGTNLRGFKL